MGKGRQEEKYHWKSWWLKWDLRWCVHVRGMPAAVELYLECNGWMGQMEKGERKHYLGVKNWADGGQK